MVLLYFDALYVIIRMIKQYDDGTLSVFIRSYDTLVADVRTPRYSYTCCPFYVLKHIHCMHSYVQSPLHTTYCTRSLNDRERKWQVWKAYVTWREWRATLITRALDVTWRWCLTHILLSPPKAILIAVHTFDKSISKTTSHSSETICRPSRKYM